MSDRPDYLHDTIVAAATPAGVGGIGIVRISGPDVPQIAGKMLGGLPPPRMASLREFHDAAGEPIDTGLALFFPAPGSFTGEPVLELHGHGGPVVMALLVGAAVSLGARQAEPGEFSKRAFLNDKLDLAQAEAIADLIGSGTAQAARAALRSLSGAFSAAVDALQEQLIRLRLHVEAALDFPEEEIDFLSDEQLAARIDDCDAAFAALGEGARAGRLLRDGYQVVIVGRPNVGKSSLLNLLSGQEAAIVTEVAGTTRDILREQINVDGLLIELIDTAGLRDNPDQIEAEGIRRARAAIKSADAVLWIQDASAKENAIENESLSALGEDLPANVPVITVRNKTDLTDEDPGLQYQQPLTLNISAKTGAGTDALREQMLKLAGHKDLGEGAFTARRRHIDALGRAEAHFQAGRNALEEAKAGELLAEELRLAQEALGQITGSFTSDDLLGKIFSTFCIGK
ncbi:MAG: tRNA uridine-5-carboxymethylaminomethyl(34) synthesis GTPase MnmE [Woeseiaceae bacterium]